MRGKSFNALSRSMAAVSDGVCLTWIVPGAIIAARTASQEIACNHEKW
jgi:hypothetical protein